MLNCCPTVPSPIGFALKMYHTVEKRKFHHPASSKPCDDGDRENHLPLSKHSQTYATEDPNAQIAIIQNADHAFPPQHYSLKWQN
jgi:hypothetical protein